MACACKTNRDIELLNRRFGNGKRETNIRGTVKSFFNGFFIVLLEMFLFPFILVFFFISLIKSAIDKEPINIKEITMKMVKIFR